MKGVVLFDKRHYPANRPVPPVHTFADGREVCMTTPAGRAEYARRTMAMWLRDEGRCMLCGLPVDAEQAVFAHKRSRGIGGGKRDDRIEMNGIAHPAGNLAQGSMSWDQYMEFSLDRRIRNCFPEAR